MGTLWLPSKMCWSWSTAVQPPHFQIEVHPESAGVLRKWTSSTDQQVLWPLLLWFELFPLYWFLNYELRCNISRMYFKSNMFSWACVDFTNRPLRLPCVWSGRSWGGGQDCISQHDWNWLKSGCHRGQHHTSQFKELRCSQWITTKCQITVFGCMLKPIS